MKRILGLFFLMLAPLTTPAGGHGLVTYVGGTVAGLKEGDSGTLDTRSQTALNFDYSGGKLIMPFKMIDSYEYSQRVARHLGVLPAIAVGLVKRRQHKHFLRISYHDESKAPQVVIFEVSKEMPHTLLAILQERAPQGCKPRMNAKCVIQTD